MPSKNHPTGFHVVYMWTSVYLASVNKRQQHAFTFVIVQVFHHVSHFPFSEVAFICGTKRQTAPRLISCWEKLPSLCPLLLPPGSCHSLSSFPLLAPVAQNLLLNSLHSRKGTPSSLKTSSEFLADLGGLLAAFIKCKGRLSLILHSHQ